LTFLASCAKVPPQAAAPVPPPQPLADFIRATITGPGVSRGTWGIVVESLTRDERLFEHNANMFLVPASVAKVVAVAAGVEGVGWSHTFETTLQATAPVVDGVLQGDLIVTGSGDPSIGGRGGDDFTSWADALKAAGIRRIDGRVIGDDDAFDDPRPGAMWAWDDLGYTSGSLYGALNFAENRMTVTVTPGRAEGGAVSLGVEPFAAERPLGNRVVTGAAGSMALIWPEQRPGEYFLTIAGSLPAGSAPVRMNVSAGNPTFWFASVLRNRLQREGIEITGAAFDIDDVLPKPDMASRRVLHAHRSRPLADVTTPLMKDSINIYAEAVLRLSSGPTGGRTNDDALEAIRLKLPSWGLPPDAMQVVDGSGLSRRDAIAASTVVTLLKRLYDSSGESPWMKGLPIAGRDGTLQNRLRGTAAEGNLLGKTGTMSNIRSLAGYVRTRGGEPLAFTIMVNNFEGTGAQAQAAIDAIAVRLAELSR
jgi:D-alanyl-D-alanine carboxypeptidase/D-alanyl-D-alanine-endopeptidase (penicillin-binding protein 4)